jgi:hypothetical protein
MTPGGSCNACGCNRPARRRHAADKCHYANVCFPCSTGAGKSYAAMKLAEGMLDAKAQIIAIDPVGV